MCRPPKSYLLTPTYSNSMVPSQVKAEIIYQARRLDSHPSLAIWGGGNEVEASFRWFPDSRDDPQSFTDDYMQVCRLSDLFKPCLAHIHGIPTALPLCASSCNVSRLHMLHCCHEDISPQKMWHVRSSALSKQYALSNTLVAICCCQYK